MNAPEAKSMHASAKKAYAENIDASKVKPSPIPLYILANKWDTFKTKSISLAERRVIFQALRFIAHFNGASLFCSSATGTDF